jgi:hypothetical protein
MAKFCTNGCATVSWFKSDLFGCLRFPKQECIFPQADSFEENEPDGTSSTRQNRFIK